MNKVKILAIETSCDETAAAVIGDEGGFPQVLSNIVSSQIDIHAQYGGVVPEVAARAHIEDILPIITEALKEAKTELNQLSHLAVTFGPGLIGSLVVGVETAKGISAATGIPVVPINHLEGHIYANFLKEPGTEVQAPSFPILALLVSGGHTLLIYVKNHLDYLIVGQTWDDAAGEAFDKAAKAMGLPYPGGPIISKLAQKGNEARFKFPIVDLTPSPARNEEGFLEHPEPSLDFSFSGLKTALIGQVKKIIVENGRLSEKDKQDLSASFEKTVVDTVAQNTLRAIKKYQPKSFILSGGVAANQRLREQLQKWVKDEGVEVFVPDLDFCTDNAAMIGAAAYFHIKENKIATFDSANPNARL